MRLLFRFLGLLCLAAAFAALIVDGTTSVAANKVELRPLGETLAKLSPEGFQAVHDAVARKLPWLWDPVLGTIFLLPAWVVLGITGLVLIALTRPRRPRIGHSRR